MGDLISRSRLIEEIKENQWGWFSREMMILMLENQPSVTDTNVGGKWILCNEKLPDIKEGKYASDCVLVTLKWWDGDISETVGWYNRTGTWSEDGKMSKVIAWMPYEPYKGE